MEFDKHFQILIPLPPQNLRKCYSITESVHLMPNYQKESNNVHNQ